MPRCLCTSLRQVAHLNVPGSELYRKLRQLKGEKGGLTSQDERHFAQIRRSLEAEVLAHADVVSEAKAWGIEPEGGYQTERARSVARWSHRCRCACVL